MTLTNEIEQENVFAIDVVAVVPPVEPKEPDPVVIEVDDLEEIESIEVEFVVVDLKGSMQIKFE